MGGGKITENLSWTWTTKMCRTNMHFGVFFLVALESISLRMLDSIIGVFIL